MHTVSKNESSPEGAAPHTKAAEHPVNGSFRQVLTPLRILYLVDSLRVGGKERQICELVKGFGGSGSVQSIVVTMGTEQFYVSEVQKHVPLFYLVRRVRWDPTVFLRLLRVLRRFRPHIIYTNSEMAMSYAWPLARLMGIKIINATIRNAFSGRGLRWQWHRLMLAIADARIGNSQAGFLSRGLHYDSPGNYVIYNGIDMSRFRRRDADRAKTLGFNAGKRKIVGMVAEFSDYKDFQTFIRAAQVVLQRRDDVVFLAVGGGKNLNACKGLASPEKQRIRFLGERQDVDLLVQQMDIGVLCTFTEGIPNSVMEFMAAGKPVIVTDGGGSRELVMDGVNGFLVPASDPIAVADKIELLLSNDNRAVQMGTAGLERIEGRFSLQALTENSLHVYQAVSGRMHSTR